MLSNATTSVTTCQVAAVCPSMSSLFCQCLCFAGLASNWMSAHSVSCCPSKRMQRLRIKNVLENEVIQACPSQASCCNLGLYFSLSQPSLSLRMSSREPCCIDDTMHAAGRALWSHQVLWPPVQSIEHQFCGPMKIPLHHPQSFFSTLAMLCTTAKTRRT